MPANHPLKSTIKAGSVYYYNDPDLKSPYSHYFIVLNVDPSKDRIIFLAYSSHKISKVQERRKGFPRETLVEISPDQYPEFSKKSIIDCNVILEKSIDMLANKFDQGKLKKKPLMGLRLVHKLREGAIHSSLVAEETKKLLQID